MSDFSVWVDADSCPKQVKKIIFRFCTRLNLKLTLVANRKISLDNNKNAEMIVCPATPNAADNYIVEHVAQNDIVITRDIPMARRLTQKNVTVINDRGTVFTKENIGERLSLRNFNMELYQNGIFIERLSTISKKDINNFSNCLDREIQKKLRQ